MLDYLLGAFDGPGAGFMVAILALGAFCMAVWLERTWLLLVRWRPSADVSGALAEGALDRAAEAGGTTPLGQVVAAGAGETTAEAAWDAMGASAAVQEARLRTRVGAVGTVANLATMLGLLGTVYGLILAFSALGDAAAAERATRLSEGISTAMATTAFGLCVGIPALAVHAWLEGVVTQRLAEIEAAAGVVALVVRRASSGD